MKYILTLILLLIPVIAQGAIYESYIITPWTYETMPDGTKMRTPAVAKDYGVETTVVECPPKFQLTKNLVVVHVYATGAKLVQINGDTKYLVFGAERLNDDKTPYMVCSDAQSTTPETCAENGGTWQQFNNPEGFDKPLTPTLKTAIRNWLIARGITAAQIKNWVEDHPDFASMTRKQLYRVLREKLRDID